MIMMNLKRNNNEMSSSIQLQGLFQLISISKLLLLVRLTTTTTITTAWMIPEQYPTKQISIRKRQHSINDILPNHNNGYCYYQNQRQEYSSKLNKSLINFRHNNNNNNMKQDNNDEEHYDDDTTTTTSSSSSNTQQNNNNDDNDGEWWAVDDLEVLQGDGKDFDDNNDDNEEDWIPDGEMARRRRQRRAHHPTPASAAFIEQDDNVQQQQQQHGFQSSTIDSSSRSSPYTDEEEELIEAMGGKYKKEKQQQQQQSSNANIKNNKREIGFLGDCTLEEIATDYSIPICYIADVLCMWGVPVPISKHDLLGDLVTGEQAFALIEAIYTLDMGTLQDRYSNSNLEMICNEWNIPIKNAFEFVMKEGYSLPFGVQTHLRIEQEEELIRTLSTE